jgi:hypothetical protein
MAGLHYRETATCIAILGNPRPCRLRSVIHHEDRNLSQAQRNPGSATIVRSPALGLNDSSTLGANICPLEGEHKEDADGPTECSPRSAGATD